MSLVLIENISSSSYYYKAILTTILVIVFLELFITSKTWYMSCLPDCRTNYDKESYKTKKYQKNLKFRWRHSLVLSFPSQDNAFATAVKKQAKVDTKFFMSCRILLDLHISFISFSRFPIFLLGVARAAKCLS